MHIGLFGGIGPGATDFYYRRLMAAFAAHERQLEMTVVHLHTPTYLGNVAGNKVAEQLELYLRMADRLKAAGADCVAVTSAAGHFCIREFKEVSPLTVIDMLPELQRTVEQQGYKKVGVIGTRMAMESQVFGGLSGIACLLPEGQERDEVHSAYVEMAVSGRATEAHRIVFDRACRRLVDRGVDAVVFGGTDLVLAFSAETTGFPHIDCAAIHADAIARAALAELVP